MLSKIKKSEKAQTAVEFILIVGAFVLISVVLMPRILSNIELSKAIAAARDGAEFAIAMRGMGYDSPKGNIKNIPEGVIKIKNMTLIDKGTCTSNPDKKWYQMKFYVYAPSYISSNSSYTSSIGATIRHYARASLYRAFHGAYQTGTSAVETDRYCFTIGYSFISY